MQNFDVLKFARFEKEDQARRYTKNSAVKEQPSYFSKFQWRTSRVARITSPMKWKRGPATKKVLVIVVYLFYALKRQQRFK
ncbi:unnamed protein product [Bursaphelenchus xylophilus]|uniref:(pine wood nematode) hypothetical protein n=1 Tax=Bursaphelenchus xylophilus TaxID=6326 RepID=A0A1I7SE37_BURXY|nr:unnamed protein product [Bursaphelenchus xylophilus]CAG9113128.1 unnamed protein product [Bursaphelenchus xylophilus]